MIKQTIYSDNEVVLQSSQPLMTATLSIIADEIAAMMSQYRPEFANLVHLHRHSGCRVNELFQAHRWNVVSKTTIQLQPQKGNALRILNFSDIGYSNAADFAATLADIARLPSRQYDRAFAYCVRQQSIWRLYDEGFARPSTHMFRHIKIKELAAQGYTNEFIATWIGEKNVQNLEYYLNSKFFI